MILEHFRVRLGSNNKAIIVRYETQGDTARLGNFPSRTGVRLGNFQSRTGVRLGNFQSRTGCDSGISRVAPGATREFPESHRDAILPLPISKVAELCYASFALLCYVRSFALLCYDRLCFALLCYAMLCFAMLCFAMLCICTCAHLCTLVHTCAHMCMHSFAYLCTIVCIRLRRRR